MYVWGGGGLQLLMAGLDRAGIFTSLTPNDPRCRSEHGSASPNANLSASMREKLLGAEMTRRTFTNVCGIMRRHDFPAAWQAWKRER